MDFLSINIVWCKEDYAQTPASYPGAMCCSMTKAPGYEAAQTP
jgi:hypothetical protein